MIALDGDERVAGDRRLNQDRRGLTGLVAVLVRNQIDRVRIAIIPNRFAWPGDLERDRGQNIMALRILAAGLEQIFARFSGDGIGQRRDDWFPIGPSAGRGRELPFPDHLQLRFAVELSRVAGGREPVRLPGESVSDEASP